LFLPRTNMAEESPLKTAQADPRFPNQNQTKHCWQNYVDYHRCVNAKGEDFAPCKVFFSTFSSLCPTGWVQKWDEQRENGIFAANLDP